MSPVANVEAIAIFRGVIREQSTWFRANPARDWVRMQLTTTYHCAFTVEVDAGVFWDVGKGRKKNE